MGARRLLLALETSIGRGPVNRSVLDDLFRHFHSLKGISGMVELRAAEQLAHYLEDYLRVLRAGEAAPTRDGLDALFAGTQTLEQVIAARRAQMPLPSIDAIGGRIAQLIATDATPGVARRPVTDAASPAPPGMQRWEISFIPSQELMARGIRVDTIRQRLVNAGEILSAAPRVTAEGAIAFDFVFIGRVDAATVAAWQRDGVQMEPADSGSPAAPGEVGDALPLETDWSLSPAILAPSHVVRVDLTRLD